MENLAELFKRLGLDNDKGLYIRSENKWQNECAFSSRIASLLENIIQPDAFFSFYSKPLILFYNNPTDKKKIFKAIWNFNESPIVFILENGSVDIFNGFEFLKDKEALKFIGNEKKLNDFTYFELVTGKTWENYESELNHKNRVDYFLLENIKAARLEIVIKVFPDWSPKLKRKNTDDEQEVIQLANNFIGKVIFVSYLIDRNVEISFEGEKKKWKRSYFCSLLEDVDKTKRFFNFLKQEDQFNGDDLFPITDDEFDIIKKYNINKILINLLNGVEISSGQQSLFDIYDFSIIPVEFISNVYESFIGENNQAKEGAYYTPLFLVEYIISQTLIKYFEENGNKYQCKVLDPACGSGIFLVESLRVMINRYKTLHKYWENNIPKFQSEIKRIATENIFGVDKDSNAINVAIFSIYLTLLDYQNPKDIEGFQFPNIRNSNFVESDFFADTDDINNLKTKGFDFILGNPPWKRGGKKNDKFIQYIKHRKKKEGKVEFPIAISNKEIAQAFIFRISDFKVSNCCALIVTSKVLYNLNAKDFRKYLLHNFLISKVFELAPVRLEIFDKSNDSSVGPAAVLFYKYSKDKITYENILEHIVLKPNRFFSLFKIFSLSKQDYKKVQQKKLKQYDWLWKTLVYGSYLDFNLILRLKDKNNYSSIAKELEDKKRFKKGQGVMVGGGDKNDASHLVGLPYIQTRKDIKSFWINSNLKKWEFSIVHRPRENYLYKSPMLLITGGISNHFQSVSAVCSRDTIFRSSLTAIKAFNNSDKKSLKTMSAILNSSFFSYYALQTFSSTGIEREESHDDEKWTVPFLYNENITLLVSKIETLKQNYFSSENTLKSDVLKNKIAVKKLEIDNAILNIFDFSDLEKELYNYANDIVIPLTKKHEGYKKSLDFTPYNSVYLEDYANLFIDRFKSNLDDDEKKFIVEIWHSNQIIGMFFKMIPASEYKEDIVWTGRNNDSIMKIVTSLSSEKITESLFVQKDVRGFEKEYFYVFKPNEKRLWHKAIGYLDVNEFMDALLLAGKGGKNE
jgi:hypothetical protein